MALDLLMSSKDTPVRAQAAKALAEIGDVSAISKMEKVQKETDDNYLKQALNVSLIKLKTKLPKN